MENPTELQQLGKAQRSRNSLAAVTCGHNFSQCPGLRSIREQKRKGNSRMTRNPILVSSTSSGCE